MPSKFIRGRSILEVGAGSGHNSLYTASQSPKIYHICEPNPVAVKDIDTLFSNLTLPHTKPGVFCEKLEDYSNKTKYDIVICEGWLGGITEYERDMMRKLSGFVALGGLLIMSYFPPIGGLSSFLRRILAYRTINERHFDCQLIGGLVLNEGKISEMKTGEGKTLVSTLPVYLNSLTGDGVHVVTVNDYLAKRDSAWMGQIYNFLGLSVGCITNEMDDVIRKKNYKCDVTYGTNNEFGFDYLRDNMKYNMEEMVQRDHFFCIVDEVDSILIDEARTPLVISSESQDSVVLYPRINALVKFLTNDDFDLNEENKSILLTVSKIYSINGFPSSSLKFFDFILLLPILAGIIAIIFMPSTILSSFIVLFFYSL